MITLVELLEPDIEILKEEILKKKKKIRNLLRAILTAYYV